jgi:hypothetical protein
MHRTRVVATALAALALSALAAAPSPAATTALGGNPLNVYVGDLGQLQAFRTGQSTGIFFAPTVTEGDAGFFIADVDTHVVYGFDGFAGPHGLTDYMAGTQGAVTGSGTASDPLTLVTTYGVTGLYAVTQTTTYVNGSQEFRIRWDVRNGSMGTLHFKALAAADFYFDGSDRGTGIFTQGPPRFIGGTNADTGNSGGFAEVLGSSSASPGWSAYQALAYGGNPTQVWGKVEGAASTSAASFDNTVVGEQVDNAGGVEWDQRATGSGLPAGQTTSFELLARNAVPSALQISPPNAGSPKGVPINFTASALDTNGTPYAGRNIRYSITGANPLAGGVATVDAAGNAVLTDPGTNAGADTLVAFVDFNNDAVRQAAEPQASALATFVDKVAPTCKVSVSGDRPGGTGGAGKPLVIKVKCNEQAIVTVQTTLQPASASSRAASVDKKKKKRKKVTIKLRTSTVTATAGKSVPVSLRIPSSVRKKYAGKTLKATITVRARDASGNVKKAKTTRTVKLAKAKKRKHRH